jgi:hypothetical protein
VASAHLETATARRTNVAAVRRSIAAHKAGNASAQTGASAAPGNTYDLK